MGVFPITTRMLQRGCSAACRRRVILLALALLCVGSHNGAPAAASSGAGVRVAQSYYFLPEVRLRKFHLVRPDLIPYPMVYEVYC